MNQEYCEKCIGCRETWSAGIDSSCHEHCDDYQEWKNKVKECQGDLSRLRKRDDTTERV